MEAMSQIGTAKPSIILSLDLNRLNLCVESVLGEDWVRVYVFFYHTFCLGRDRRIEANKDIFGSDNILKLIHPIGYRCRII